MRISVIKNDPGYIDDYYDFEVFLDEKRVKDCITADSMLGIVWIFNKSQYGPGVMIKTGKVKIVKHHKRRNKP